MPALIERFVRDRTSGAAELAVQALDILDAAASKGVKPDELERLRQRLCRAHSAMGSVWNAVHSADRRAFRRCLHHARKRVARSVRRRIERGAHVVTLSYSSTVVAALSRRDLTVTVAESRPGGEGAKTARRLRAAGVAVRMAADAELGIVIPAADVVVVGADAITPRLVINKVGTKLLALVARHAAVSALVAADRTKLVPPRWPVPVYRRSAPFEATPRRLFSEIVDDR